MNESTIQKSLLRKLRKIPHSKWYNVSDRFGAGRPDIMGCIDGRFFAIEVKYGKGKLTELQKYELLGWLEAGGIAFCIRYEPKDKYYYINDNKHSFVIKEVIEWISKHSRMSISLKHSTT